MSLTDPLADMLTRIRNAGAARFDKVDIPASQMKISVARILEEEGYIRKYKVIKDRRQGILRIYLRYDEQGKPLIQGLKRVSKLSRRVYASKDDIPLVLGGLGVAIVSTSQGIMTDRQARQQGVGGEVLCSVW
ncbi:MAG: 30S ribosomal protein S8 [Deltaproteobacteria bacterium]|nr:30S ribosomal protein S8 [Deltaproteobacteria bacterium]MBW1952782.1 30S ribosomal protein S8 [Deltaproteobacteria bacterium]MBW1987101.1 30S ribosomal protein S8 [Deltaproteobacteria bacterium]MBW2135391.1 30S ribosomal protein S8 [Deltaproteobacteria bacterium]